MTTALIMPEKLVKREECKDCHGPAHLELCIMHNHYCYGLNVYVPPSQIHVLKSNPYCDKNNQSEI